MTALEIETNFPGDIDAIVYFEHLRWGDKVKCAYCGTDKVSQRQVDHRFHCSQCRKTFSVTTRTRLHNSKLPLKVWMQAFSLVSSSKDKIRIKELQHSMNVSYSTAWYILNDIRRTMKEEFGERVPENLFETLCKKAISVNYS